MHSTSPKKLPNSKTFLDSLLEKKDPESFIVQPYSIDLVDVWHCKAFNSIIVIDPFLLYHFMIFVIPVDYLFCLRILFAIVLVLVYFV